MNVHPVIIIDVYGDLPYYSSIAVIIIIIIDHPPPLMALYNHSADAITPSTASSLFPPPLVDCKSCTAVHLTVSELFSPEAQIPTQRDIVDGHSYRLGPDKRG